MKRINHKTLKVGIVIAAWVGIWGTPAFARPAFVEVTGQTQCWDAEGDPINCDSTGQDGDVQAGVPFPTPRFTDKGNGTVEDNLTKLTWLKDANCFGPQTWQNALDAANGLADDPTNTTPDCGLTDGSVAGDWRLPNVKELQSLIDFGFVQPALSNAAGIDKWTEENAFSDVRSAHYWSSTTYADRPNLAWGVSLFDGNTITFFNTLAFDKGDLTLLVWPVRGIRKKR